MKKVSSILVIATVLMGSAAYAAQPYISIWPESAWFCTGEEVQVGEVRAIHIPALSWAFPRMRATSFSGTSRHISTVTVPGWVKAAAKEAPA